MSSLPPIVNVRATCVYASVLAMLLLGLCVGAGAAWGASPAREPRSVIVKFASQGESALKECAEALFDSGRPFASATANHSDSIDRLNRSLRVRRVRALFRNSDGRPFSAQRWRSG